MSSDVKSRVHVGQDIEKGWYGIPARAGSMTDVQMAQRPTLAARMARLRGFASGYALQLSSVVYFMQHIHNTLGTFYARRPKCLLMFQN